LCGTRFEFAELPLERNVDPFTALIRCTCDDGADNETISKWARALRYIAHCKDSGRRLKTFMKEIGEVNACGDKYANISWMMRDESSGYGHLRRGLV
jgi:hypothetical protein